jgi:hypothetical protein
MLTKFCNIINCVRVQRTTRCTEKQAPPGARRKYQRDVLLVASVQLVVRLTSPPATARRWIRPTKPTKPTNPTNQTD